MFGNKLHIQLQPLLEYEVENVNSKNYTVNVPKKGNCILSQHKENNFQPNTVQLTKRER